MPKVFVSYASEDREPVQDLSARLRTDGFDVWRDSEQILPGDDWEREILQALGASDMVIICFSAKAIGKRGYVQKEWRAVLNVAEHIPLDSNFIIPLRLDACELPFRFRPLHRVDWFSSDAYDALLKGLRTARLEPAAHRRPSICNVPAPALHFTGREELLHQVSRQISKGKATAITALFGLPGIGKSQLARRYADDHAADYSIRWQVESEPSPAAGLLSLARKLGLPETHQPNDEITITAVLEWLRLNDGWLLIFDNAASAQALQRYLPAGAGRVLITSRDPNWGAIAEPLAIDEWSEAESVAFLLGRTRQQDIAAATQISKELDGLPLALEQAGAYVEVTGGTLAGYEKLLRTHAPALLAKYPPPEYARNAAATFALSFEHLERESPRAMDLLSLFAFLAPDDIPESLLDTPGDTLPANLRAALADDLERDELFAALRKLSLVQRVSAGLWVHRVVQTLLRARLLPALGIDWASVAAQALDEALQKYDRYDTDTWAVTRRLESHALSVLAHMAKGDLEPEARIRIGATLSWLAKFRGDLAAALSLSQASFSLSNRIFGDEHPATVISINALAPALEALGRFNEAKELLKKALDVSRGVFGATDSRTLTTANNLAEALSESGDLAGARKIQEEVLTVRRRAPGIGHPTTIASINNLAGTLRLQGDLAAARALYEEALPVCQRILGQNHPNTISLMNNLANSMFAQDDSGAVALMEDAITRYVQAEGPEHPATLNARLNLSEMMRKYGQLDAAEKLQREILTLRQRSSGEDHPATLNTQHSLASTLSAQGRGSEARAIEEKVLGARARILGPRHTDTTLTAWNLYQTCILLNARYAARQVAREYLVWLQTADDVSLSGDQRKIKQMAAGPGHGSAGPNRPEERAADIRR